MPFPSSQSAYLGKKIPNPALLHTGGAIQCANRCFFPNGVYAQATTETSATNRSYHQLFYDCTGIRLVYTNNFADSTADVGDTKITNTLNIKCLVEYNSQKWEVFWDGQRTVNVPPGGTVISDPIVFNVDTTVTKDLWVRTFVDAGPMPVSTTKMWPRTTGSVSGSFAEGITVSSDLTDIASGAVGTSNNASLYTPCAILAINAVVTTPSVCIIGDSIPYGNGDMQYAVPSYEGFLARALNTLGYPYLKVCIPSDRGKTFAENNLNLSRARMQMAQFCTHAVYEYGHNDIASGGDTLANLKIYAANTFKVLKQLGLKVFATTLTPQCTSTDKFVTTTNQTVGTNFTTGGIIDQYNSWLTTGGITNLDGVLDIRALVQDTTTPTKWKTATSVYDGIVSSATINSITVSGTPFAANQYTGYVLIITGGASTGNVAKMVFSNTNNTLSIYSFVGGSNFSPTPSASDTFSLYPVMTIDGTHPSSWGHNTIATGLDLSVLTI